MPCKTNIYTNGHPSHGGGGMPQEICGADLRGSLRFRPGAQDRHCTAYAGIHLPENQRRQSRHRPDGRRRIRRLFLYRILEREKFRRQFRPHRRPQIPGHGHRQAHQSPDLQALPQALPRRQDLLHHDRSRRFTELTDDPEFWKGCQGCRHYDILESHDFKMCICTGLLYDPQEHLEIHHPDEEAGA